QRRENGHLPLHFTRVIITDCVSFLNATHAVQGTTFIEHCFGQHCLTAALMSDQGHIANVAGVKYVHRTSPLLTARSGDILDIFLVTTSRMKWKPFWARWERPPKRRQQKSPFTSERAPQQSKTRKETPGREIIKKWYLFM